ncbi:uncharacterized protein Z519_03631 [Cladophialophora bantiana CBS 173.52]|uniref:Uncharacterized protein n=1 Tax=Cladophialophora bantiana (strain ATCC 10958 / CBS 173.52 / CDC B-1940 / NIH 8579) TaxID=1442370 RepID=A0A0D2HVT8_CLAB1|nr:uncharacterized protein Z519_03631 [Cladophialophora bantiana CBS 173.52]KIW95050.1 hypothetical protein Z519_03631 [Cladophialophora bantiana CBS 173.52]
MSDTPTHPNVKRSTTPASHGKDGLLQKETIQLRVQKVPFLPRLPFLVEARTKLPIIGGLLLTCSPSIYLYSLETSRDDHHQRTDPNLLVWTYFLTGTVGIAVAMLVQSILAYLLAFLCFNGHTNATTYLAETMKTEHDDIKDEAHRRRRLEMSRRPGYWVFMLFFSFVVAGLVEEVVKYIATTTMLGLLAQRSPSSHGSRIGSARDHIAIAVSAGLGFATVENIAFFAAARRRKPSGDAAPAAPNESQKAAMFALLTAVERVLLGIPGHAMTAALIGVNMLVRNHQQHRLGHGHDFSGASSMMTSAWLVVRDSVLFHGCSNFVLFAVSAAEGNVGWVHPRRARTVCFVLAVLAGLQAVLALVLRARLCRCGLC